MTRRTHQNVNTGVFVLATLIVTGVYFAWKYNLLAYIRTQPFSHFTYPLHVDMVQLTDGVLNGDKPKLEPLNKQYFPYILSLDKKCKTPEGDDEDVFVIFLIKSKVDNFQQRLMIRKTWAGEFVIPFVKVKRVFFLGTDTNDRQIQHRVGLEAQEYDDIVQHYYSDEYTNNTLKLMLGFQWLVNYCRTARYVVSADDDLYVNTRHMVDYLQSKVKLSTSDAAVIGYIWEKSMPIRTVNSIWYTSLEEYSFRYWPPYPTSGCTIMPYDTAARIQAAMPFTQFLRFDDVYLGIIAHKLKIQLIHNPTIYSSQKTYSTASDYENVMASRGFHDVELLYKVWKEVEQLYERRVAESRAKFKPH